jgi:hypothetical protein
MTRRDWLYLAGSSALWAQEKAASPDLQSRIAHTIHAYEEQGAHRTGTKVDENSGDWLAAEVRKTGLTPSRETFQISRVDPVTASISIDGRRIEGIPLFDGSFTGPSGIAGSLGVLGTDAPIGLTEGAPNTAGAGPIGEARRQSRHRAIVFITRGGRPGLCPSNADRFLNPFGPPVLQVSSEEADALNDAAMRGSEVTLFAQVKRTPAEAFNVIASVRGTNRVLPPLVVMTPRSGWWSCASERGGGIVCWIELMRAMRGFKPARDVIFVASSGHEIGYRGIEIFTERRLALVKGSRAWIHLGANIGAAQQPGNTVQASDDEMETMLANAMMVQSLAINRRVPRGTIPGGEAGVVHRGGGRYMSLIGSNSLFHNPSDRGREAIDSRAIARFVSALTAVAQSLAEEGD